MQDFERLGVFYLGRLHDMESQEDTDELLLYDSRDLVTHAVCVGMTGSGKTGLCIGLLEEAAIDGIPAIVIDPKGDLGNLLLAFPELRPADFEPWVDAREAEKKGQSVSEFAAAQAELWRNGLAGWGQDETRIRRFKDAAEFAIYTPGSSAGRPVAVLKSFAAPAAALREDPELLAERIETSVSGVLQLLGIDADPIQSREHILLSKILDEAWQRGEDLDLAGLIQAIQSPPIDRVGVLDVETFYPGKERFELALRLNNLLAAPGFETWLEGEALDIDRFLYTPEGKPRVAIFSIAHLDDTERMFFVTLLLNELVGWMRVQSGTSSLRALLYMDEIFGFFPPVAKPPSKAPLLTLFKQARAFGLGVVVATQNPVDLDYKGLSNAGTWFLGRLQTERDKARVIEGLEGVAAGSGFDRGAMEETLAGLGKRVFLMNNVHERGPVIFRTRWVLSYLRGPLTRDQIKRLTAAAAGPPGQAPVGTGTTEPKAPQATPGAGASAAGAAVAGAAVQAAGRPVLPPSIPEYFVPPQTAPPAGAVLAYRPALYGAARLSFVSTKAEVDHSLDVGFLVTALAEPVVAEWTEAEALDVPPDELETEPRDSKSWGAVPVEATRARSYKSWAKSLSDWLYRSQQLELLVNPVLRAYSRPFESERDFRIRLGQAAREYRDAQAEKLRKKYEPKIDSLEDRVRRAEQAVAREKDQAQRAHMDTIISVGSTLVGAFLGRKTVSRSGLGRATTAARGAGRSRQQAQDVSRAKETLEAHRERLQELEDEFSDEVENLEALAPQDAVEAFPVRLRRKDIDVRLVCLAWAPYWESPAGGSVPAWE